MNLGVYFQVVAVEKAVAFQHPAKRALIRSSGRMALFTWALKDERRSFPCVQDLSFHSSLRRAFNWPNSV